MALMAHFVFHSKCVNSKFYIEIQSAMLIFNAQEFYLGNVKNENIFPIISTEKSPPMYIVKS